MSGRFSIWVREIESDHDVELCRVNSDPHQIVVALRQKTIKVGKGRKLPKYDFIRVVDNEATP